MRVTRMGLRVKTIETVFKCRGKIINTKDHLSTLKRSNFTEKKIFPKYYVNKGFLTINQVLN